MWAQLAGTVLGGMGGAAAQGPDQVAQETSATFQGGSLVLGARQVGGRGNEAGATTSAAAQSPSGQPATAVAGSPLPNWLPWAIVAGVVALFALFRR